MGLTVRSWLMYASILLYVGGIIVLFCYIVSLIFFRKVVLGSARPATVLILGMGGLASLYLGSPGGRRALSGIYSRGNEPILLYIRVYLLGVLVAVVKMVTGWEGSIKTILKNDALH